MFNIDTFRHYEKSFRKDGENSFTILSGKGPVMISAPHSVEHMRNGEIKAAEPQTGALTMMLHHQTGCPVIYKTKNCGDDPNYDNDSPYKQALAEYIKNNGVAFLIDLHQLSPTREVQVHIGTGRMRNISSPEFFKEAVKVFETRNIGPIHTGDPFDASMPYTISSYISSTCKISCLQIELNSDIVRSDGDNPKAEKVFEALADLIANLTDILTGA